jgi:23S rRNA (pseudouridine1915-N3)-methyltransferase
MLNLELMRVGSDTFSQTTELVSIYEARLKRYTHVTTTVFQGENRFLSGLKKRAQFHRVLLDPRGKQWSSENLASRFLRWREARGKVVFCVGGAYGFSDAARGCAHELWSLSTLTLPGDVAWLILWEQVFRAFTILHRTGYHHR